MKTWSLISTVVLLCTMGCCSPKGTTEQQGSRTEAPDHQAPDQERIDSLKLEKAKGKM